jgi:hypothetical protein
MIGRKSKSRSGSEVVDVPNVDAVIAELRTVVFDTYAWQNRVAERQGIDLGPIREGAATDGGATDQR